MSWEQLVGIRQEQREIAREDRERESVACHYDGEPLEDAGAALHCKFCGRTYRK